MIATATLALVTTLPAAPFNGAIFTTDVNGTTVNGNIYADATDVYLNGGPQNMHAAGLPDGIYYFEVTDPSGQTVLSTDQAVCRQLQVAGGVVAGATGPCPHPNGATNSNNGSTTVQLSPFSQTPNLGGEYKVYLIAQTANTSIDTDGTQTGAAPGVGLIFNNDDEKSDNFKVKNSAPTPIYITGVKWYDTNTNGAIDSGEPYIPGWHIDAYCGLSGLTFMAYTDQNGKYSILADPATTYTISEKFPNATWIATTPTSGDVDTGKTLTGPNFGNVCVGSGGGLTIGYWGNKNGAAEWVNPPASPSLYLVNSSGNYVSPFASYSTFKTWLQGATATNMAYMLSAQVAGMFENINGGTIGPNGVRTAVSPGALINVTALPATYSVPAGCSLPTITKGGFATIADVMTAASCALSKVPVATSGSAYRSYEEWLKNQLNAANNDTTFVQVPTGNGIPASCSFPAFAY
jgi:hypothetical protein